jgi:hypothetical protein
LRLIILACSLRPGTRLQEYVCENNEDPARFEELDKKGLITREK